MSRKNKIIVSVVGIVIVTLALLGITYAYYLTRIQGNTNTNSISITTANLLLKYDDGSGAIVEENIMPGVTFTKTFSVTNEGNAKIDNYVVYLEEVVNDLTRTEDLTYKLTCSSTSGDCAGGIGEYPKLAGIIATNSIEVGVTHNYTLTVTYENLPNTDQSIDMGSRISGYIQIYNLQDIVDLTGSVTNAVDGDYVQINSVQKISQIVDGKYTLGAVEPGNHTITVRYIDENDEEQIRSTKTITIQKGETSGVSGNVITVTNDSQIVNINIDATNAENTTINNTIKEYNPFNEGTLAYNIYKNKAIVKEYDSEGTFVKNVTNKTVTSMPSVITGVSDGKDITDTGLFTTLDDYGTSYVYRGTVTNNYVSFAGFTWRVVRINGDGSVRLILDGTLDLVKKQGESYYVYKNAALYALDTDGIVKFNENSDDNAYVGYMYGEFNTNSTSYDDAHENIKSSTIKTYLEEFYNQYIKIYQNDYIADTMFCADKTRADGYTTKGFGTGTSNKTYYGSYDRLFKSSTESTPTVKCGDRSEIADTALTDEQLAYSRYTSKIDMTTHTNKGVLVNNDLTYPIGLISADELVMAGAFKATKNQYYYLYDAYGYATKTLNSSWKGISPYYFAGSYANEFLSSVSYNSLSTNCVDNANGDRPVINLKAGILFNDGVGTIDSPYTVKVS